MVRDEAHLGRGVRQALRRRAASFGLTENSALLAAYAWALASYSSSKHFTLSVAADTRDLLASGGAGGGSLMGQCMDMLLIEVDARGKGGRPPRFADLARRLQRDLSEARAHSLATSGVGVMGRLSRRDETPGRAPSPYVFASTLGMLGAIGAAGVPAEGRQQQRGFGALFTWFGHVRPARTYLSIPQVQLSHQVMSDLDGSLHFNFDYGKHFQLALQLALLFFWQHLRTTSPSMYPPSPTLSLSLSTTYPRLNFFRYSRPRESRPFLRRREACSGSICSCCCCVSHFLRVPGERLFPASVPKGLLAGYVSLLEKLAAGEQAWILASGPPLLVPPEELDQRSRLDKRDVWGPLSVKCRTERDLMCECPREDGPVLTSCVSAPERTAPSCGRLLPKKNKSAKWCNVFGFVPAFGS